MANDIDKTSPHYKGDFGSIYEVNKKFPTGGVAGDFVVIEGWAHYWNADRASWCVNAERDSYWDELITNIIEKFKLVRGATYMGVASLDTVPAKVIGAKMYYFATVSGTYKNFGDLVVPQGINVLYSENGSSWVNTTLLEVAQELGVSTNKVVSQKALNDALNLKANQEEMNRLLNDLEKKIGDRFVVEGNVTNLPDEEDLTSVKESERDVLKLADRSYVPQNFSGKGYKILRKNIEQVAIAVTDSTKREFRNILTPDMINQPNTIYEIRYDFDLDGEVINIQQNCSLKFCGGHLKNGTIVGNNTILINFEDELRDESSVKYDGSFICRQNFIYETIADARKYVNFPGKIVSTIGYTFANDNGGCRYKVVTIEQASVANSFFKNYWLYSYTAAKTGMFVPIEDERLWLMYADTKTEVNLSVFGIVYDANYYNSNDKLWYSDKEFKTLATDNYKNFAAAIGQTKWWSLRMIPSTYVLSNTIVINSPLLLEHGSHSFILKGTGYQEGRITTNKEIEALLCNIYGHNSPINSLTGTSYHLDNIYFDGNYKATDCLVVKNGYEADSIEHCAFFNAKENGIRMWGISSTFKVNNITAFDNGLYGVSICSTWTHDGKEYTQYMEGQLSLFEISGDNNKALIGIDVKGNGASINIHNLKCEDRSTDKTDHCTIYIKNISIATGVNITGAFSNTETPFVIIDSSSLDTPCLRLNNIFNNRNDIKSIIIDDRKNNKKVYNHSSGNSCVSLIYRDNYSSDTFKTGLSQYSNGEYNGGVINDVNFKTKKSLEAFNTAFSDYRKGYSNLATIDDNDGGIIFSDKNSDWIDVFGNILHNVHSVSITCENNNYYYLIDLAKDFSRNTLFKVTFESVNFTGRIIIATSDNSQPKATINDLEVKAKSKVSFYSSIYIQRYLILRFVGGSKGDIVKVSVQSSVNLPLAIVDIDNRVHYSMLSSGSDFPNIDNTYQGKNFVKDKNKYIANSDGKWVLESKGVEYNKYGNTSSRPQLDSSMEGFTYYDSTLKKMILWNGTTWVNLDGTALVASTSNDPIVENHS